MLFKQTFLLGASLLISGLVSAQTTQRIPLYESFTSSTCPPCNPGNEFLENLFSEPENEGKFTSLKYQMSWPGSGDPYYTAEGGSRRGFYGVNSVPRLELDGGFDLGPTDLTQEAMNEAYAVESVLELDALYQVDVATQTVTIQVSAKALQEIESSGGLFLRVAIFEKLTTGNIKSNGETEFEHVMKKMLPTATGTLFGGMDADEVQTFDFSYTFNGDYILPADAGSPINHSENHTVEEFSDLGVVVWVQRSTTKSVLQSAYATLGTASIQENTDQESISQLTVYPNPTKDFTNVIFATAKEAGDATLTIMDNTGKIVYQQMIPKNNDDHTTVEINTENFDSGLYVVVLSTKEGRKSKKLSVIR